MATSVRSLDIAQEATMGAVALNNKVVSMRPVVRRAKLFVTRRIIRHIKKLENKKGTPEQVEKNKRKAERLLEEVKIIRHVKPDKVSKYALANTDKFDDVCKQAGTSLETRALCRLSLNPVLQKVVTEFREQHYDWKSLAAYLLTKETGRKYKIKKKGKNQKIVSTNITASKTLVQTYLGAKLGKEVLSNLQVKWITKTSNKAESDVSAVDQSKCFKIDQMRYSEIDQMRCSEIDQSRCSESNEHSGQAISESENSFVMGSSSEQPLDNDSEGSELDSNEFKEKARNREEIRKSTTSHNKDSSSESSSLPVTKDELVVRKARNTEEIRKKTINPNINSLQESSSLSITKDELVVRKARNKEEIRKKTINPNINSLQESSSLSVTKDEMVVRRIDLDHLDWERKKESELPTFLLQNPNKESKDKKILKDTFFAASDDDHDSERDKDDIDNSSEEEEEHHDAENLYDNDKTEKKISKSHFRNQGEKSSLWSGKRAFESTFVGSLSEKKSEARQNFSFKEKRLQNRSQGFEKDFRQNSARSWDGSKGRPHLGKRKAYDSRPISKTFNKFSAQDRKWSQPDFQRNFKQQSVNGQSFSGGKKSAKAAEKEVLHPSWQASKIKKEQEKIHQFQGKKIKFEDD
ncbi:hypothetical protein CHS0354_040270 [Potamilus streckersoni]|uniref:Serum response factor-binding protein 1 n=1 Tax=Potamilus streckersoni TaxID=2493646 RepID=A0AAE0S4N8_9BIVA|nr:hypothetical protein CHS0354_040270 [Potamilus streckersoni]